jgi:hypothetical protein
MSSEFNILLGKKIAEAMAKDALSAAAVVLQTATKVELNKGGPGAPSRPPNPPHKQTGTLGRSIQIDDSKNFGPKPSVRVGTKLVYARRLEYGFAGTDSKGRTIFQAARPYLRPALDRSKKKMQKAATAEAKRTFDKLARRGGRG